MIEITEKNNAWKDNNMLDGLFTGSKPSIQINSNFKYIDGVYVSTKGAFTPDPVYMFDRYNLFNKKYFEDSLPYLDIDQFKVKNSKDWLGLTTYKCAKYARTKNLVQSRITSISLSTIFDRTEKTYCTTMLHEMIHVYQVSVLKIEADHGRTFLSKMEEINSKGDWNVYTKETTEEFESRGGANSDITDKISRTKYLGVIEYPKYYLSLLFSKNNVDRFKDKIEHLKRMSNTVRLLGNNVDTFKSAKIYEIIDSSYFVTWSATTLKGSLSGYRMNRDELENLIKDGKIKDTEIKLTESLANNDSMIVSKKVLKELPEDNIVIEEVSII